MKKTRFRSSFMRLCLVGWGLFVMMANLSAEGVGFKSDDLAAWLKQAQMHNPELQAFEQRYEMAMQRIPQAVSLPDPKLQVTHFVESVQTRTGPQENVFMLSQQLPWFGKLSAREGLASAEAQALWYAYQSKQLEILKRVSLAYFEYGYTKESLRLTGENLSLLRKLEPIVEDKVRGGADINALLRLKVEIGKVDDRRQSLQRTRIAQSSTIRELLALPDASLVGWPVLSAPDQMPSWDAVLLKSWLSSQNPELKMLEQKIESAEARGELARLQDYPDVTLGLNYIQVGDPVVNPATPDAGKDPWGVTLAISIPLWREKYNASKAEAFAQARSALSEYDSRRNKLLAELTSSLAMLEDASRRLTLYGEELLALAEQAVENSRASYRSGQTGMLEVIDSERSLLDLQLLYWRAATDAWQQRIIIQSLTNQPILETSNPAQSDETEN